MAISSTGSVSGYTIGGKPLGVQLGTKSATALLGNSTSATSLFASNLTGNSGGVTVDARQIAIKGMQDQIDRLQGFRTDLSVAEKQELANYQKTIQDFNEIASTRLLNKYELADRAEAYIESYKILGKEYADFTNDATVTALSSQLEDLIATKPKGAEAVRLERLQNVLNTIEDQINSSDSGATDLLTSRGISVARQINQLTAARPISSLSQDEIRQHDELVEKINSYVGFELDLTSGTKLKIERLQNTIDIIQQGGTTSGSLFV